MSEMKCLICDEELIESEDDCEIEFGIDDGIFHQYYTCPNCNSEFVCSSNSGDMVPEYLEIVSVSECKYEGYYVVLKKGDYWDDYLHSEEECLETIEYYVEKNGEDASIYTYREMTSEDVISHYL